MKHIKLFEQFINEAYSSDKARDAIINLFIKAELLYIHNDE